MSQDYQQDQRKQEAELKKEYDLKIASWREALKSKEARKVIYDILDMCGIYADKFRGDDFTFILLGRETVGLDILKRLEEADKQAYPRLLLEMNDA